MSSKPLALRLRGLSKTYRITKTKGRPGTLGETLAHRARHPFARAPREDFAALTDVSFDVEEGEAVGLIGRNGAGKSTLLKILSRIVVPTSGTAHLYGRVGSLLEVGTGFHPELTGRENVFLNGAILGMRRREIASKFDSIVAFAQVERFLDTPVKRYSSGMYVRLAFAVSAHLNPDILIVDEVLAVGDAEFQKRCLGKMSDVSSQEGRTVLFVSHNMTAVESFCPRCLYLNEGRIVHDGPTNETIDRYLSAGSQGVQEDVGVFDLSQSARGPTSAGILQRVELRDTAGRPTDTIRMGEGLIVSMDVKGLSLPRHSVSVQIMSSAEAPLVTINTHMNQMELHELGREQDRVVLTIPRLPLVHGHYSLSLAVLERKVVIDRVDRAATFEVRPADVYGRGYQMSGSGPWAGIFFVESLWEVQSDEIVLGASPGLRAQA